MLDSWQISFSRWTWVKMTESPPINTITLPSLFIYSKFQTRTKISPLSVFDNYNKAIFTKHIMNCSFNNDLSGLLMNMMSPSNKHPLYDTWRHSYLPKRNLADGVNMGVVVRWHLSVYLQNKKYMEKIIRKNHLWNTTLRISKNQHKATKYCQCHIFALIEILTRIKWQRN